MRKKTILSTLLCASLAFALIFSLSAFSPVNKVTNVSATPEYVDAQPDNLAMAPTTAVDTVVDNIEDVVEDDEVEYCELGNHMFSRPTFEMSDEYIDLYFKEEICLCCGLQYRTAWVMHFSEGATDTPSPGSIYDTMLYVDYCSDERYTDAYKAS